MQRIHSFTLAGALAVAFTAASAVAQTPAPREPAGQKPATASPDTRRPAGTPATADSDFVQKAAAAGRMEVEHGKMAAAKAANAQVKAFAQKLVKDHTAANQQLMTIAKRKNIEVPGTAEKAAEPTWTGQTGAAHDRGFVEAQVKAHQDAIALFERQAANGSDAELKSFASKQLPGLRAHLKQAQDLQAKLATSTSRR